MSIAEVSVTAGELSLLTALHVAGERTRLADLYEQHKLDRVVQVTLWERTAGALVRKGLLSRSRSQAGTLYQLTPFGREYMAGWVKGQDEVTRWQPPVKHPAGEWLREQATELAGTIAAQAQALADGTVTGPRYAAVQRIKANVATLESWTEDDRGNLS
jgi:hypothetical protein